MSNNQLSKPDPNDHAESSSEYSRWRELCGIQLKEKLRANIHKRQKTFEDVVSMAAMKISRDSTLEIIQNPLKFKITPTITNEATNSMCRAIDAWPGVHLSQCKKLPPIFKKYWRIADNWWNRQKGKYFGDLFFQPILHYSLHRYCKKILIHKNNDIEYQYLFYIFLHDIIMAQVSFKKARPNPLIFDLALEKSPKLQQWFTTAGEQHAVKWQSATNKTTKKSMKQYSRDWVKCVRDRKKMEYAKYLNGDDIEHINSLLNTFHDGSGSMIKRGSGSRSRSHSHSHSHTQTKSGSFHEMLSHSRDNSNNSSNNNHNRTTTNNSNISNLSNLMNESEMKSSPNPSPMNDDDNMTPDMNTNTVTDAQRVQSSKEYAKLRDECKALKMALKTQQIQQQMMAEALNSMQMYQTYGNYGTQPSMSYAEQLQYEQQLQQQQQQQVFNLMQDFQSNIQSQQQARQYQTDQDYEYIKQEQDDQNMNDTPNYADNYYGARGPDDKSSIFSVQQGHNYSQSASINQPEFLPQPVAPRYSILSAPDYNGSYNGKRRESGPLPPPLQTGAGKQRRESYHDVLSMKQPYRNRNNHNDTDGGLSHSNSVQSLHTNHTNGGSTLTTASQTTIISHTNMAQLTRQSTPTTNTGLSTPSGSDTSFFSSHSHAPHKYGGIHGYNADYKPSWPHGHPRHAYAPSHGPGYSYIGGHQPHTAYPPNHNHNTYQYQQQHRNQQRTQRGVANKSTSVDVGSHNGSVDVKSVSMASHNSNTHNNNGNNNNSPVDLSMHLPPPTMMPIMSQPHPQQPISPLPSVKQSNNLLPPPTSSRRASMVSSHQSLSNSGAITPPSHSNNNSINLSLAGFDDFNMNMIANINSNFSDNPSDNKLDSNSNIGVQIPFDTTAMEMDNNIMNNAYVDINNILAMHSGSNFDAGQTSSQSQNRLFMNNSVTNMSISGGGGNGMSISNSYVDAL